MSSGVCTTGIRAALLGVRIPISAGTAKLGAKWGEELESAAAHTFVLTLYHQFVGPELMLVTTTGVFGVWTMKGWKLARTVPSCVPAVPGEWGLEVALGSCTPPPCISYANVRNYYGPYAHCSLDKGVACAQHIQLLAHTCACAWYECTLTSAHISKCMQTQESLGNMKISGSHPCWHKQ